MAHLALTKKASMINDMTEGSVSKLLFKFAWPFVLSNLLQTVYNMADMVIVGQYVGEGGVTSVAMGGEVLIFFTFFCLGFVNSGQVLISQFVGRKDYKNVSKTIGLLFTLMLILAVAVTGLGLIFSKPILRLLQVPDAAMQGAIDYTQVCFTGIIFIFGYNGISAIMRGMGDSKHPLMFICISASLNIVLDIVCVKLLHMGAGGAALATVVSQGVALVTALIFLVKNKESFGFDFKLKSFGFDKFIFTRILKLGIPMVLQISAISISMMVVNAYINSYNVVAYSDITAIGNKLGNIMNIVTGSLNAAGAGMIGQNIAAGKTERVSRVVEIITLLGLAFAAIISVLMILIPSQIFALFTSDQEVQALAKTYVWVAVINFFGFSTRAPAMALINGMGFAGLAFVAGILDGVVVRIGLALLLGLTFGMGIYGFWYGMVIAGHAFGVVGAIYYFSGKWKTRKAIIE
jgi:putative MATE family efflux protein